MSSDASEERNPPYLDPRDALWDYAAGDLTAEQRAAVEAIVSSDPQARQELQRILERRAALAPSPTMPPVPDMVARLRSARAQPRRSHAWWRSAALIASAASLVVGGALGAAGMAWLGSRTVQSAPHVIAWTESGAPISMPRDAVNMPIAAHFASFQRYTGGAPAAAAQPWLGVVIRPIDVDLPGLEARRGHLVVQVDAGSPAFASGIRPGDVMLSLADWKLHTPECIVHGLSGKKPGDTVAVAFYCVPSKSVVTTGITLGTRWD